jgi:hypothetical protein
MISIKMIHARSRLYSYCVIAKTMQTYMLKNKCTLNLDTDAITFNTGRSVDRTTDVMLWCVYYCFLDVSLESIYE